MASVITSITGLQNLTGLTRFNADWNGLQSVNLSNLPNLLDVDISENDIPGSTTNSLRFVNLSGSTAIQFLRLDDSDFSTGIPDISALESLELLDLDQCGISGSLDLSGFPALYSIDVNGNPEITSVTISDTQAIDNFNARNCSLTQTVIDDILVALSTNGVSNGFVDIQGVSNAIPSATGLAAVSVLEDDGWNVNVSQAPLPFDMTANWSLANPPVVDEASFRTFLGSGNPTDIGITDFQLIDGRLTCNLVNYFTDVLYFQNLEITDVDKFGNFVRLEQINLDFNQIVTFDPSVPLPNCTALSLRSNQIVSFNPTLPLPDSITTIFLNSNQMTTAGYTASEPWANAMSVIPGRGQIHLFTNPNSVSGTNLETILISKGWTVIA